MSVNEMRKQIAEHTTDDEEPYSRKYIKQKLREKYGDGVVFVEREGQETVVCLIESIETILTKFKKTEKQSSDLESEKLLIVETAAKLIMSDVKNMECDAESRKEYPSINQLKKENCLEFVPMTLRKFLDRIFVGTGTDLKIALIGQAIIQNARPRSLTAPMILALGIQLHSIFRSRFLIDQLHSLGFCASYSEVMRFEKNAAAINMVNPLGQVSESTTVMFVGDNADHNTRTVDGKGTFHGLAIMAALTPGNTNINVVPRENMSELRTVSNEAKIEIKEYNAARRIFTDMRFRGLDTLDSTLDLSINLDILWELAPKFESMTPSWSGMMIKSHCSEQHPGKSSYYFLPMIDLPSTDETCLYSALSYISQMALEYKIQPIVTFDQPLYWKCAEMVECLPDVDPVKKVLVMLGGFHLFMNFIGAIGDIMTGLGIESMFEEIYAQNVIPQLLNGKSIYRAFRAHQLLAQVMMNELSEPLMENQKFVKHLSTMEELYRQLISGDIRVQDQPLREVTTEVSSCVSTRKQQVIESSRTGYDAFSSKYFRQIQLPI